MSTATKARLYGCTRCGRRAADRKGWQIRGPEVIVSGVQLGTCQACFTGIDPDQQPCEGKCSGDYEGGGEYWVCEVRTTGFGRLAWRRKWACWDKRCAERWAEESTDDGWDCACPHCPGDHEEYRIVQYENGERIEAKP